MRDGWRDDSGAGRDHAHPVRGGDLVDDVGMQAPFGLFFVRFLVLLFCLFISCLFLFV